MKKIVKLLILTGVILFLDFSRAEANTCAIIYRAPNLLTPKQLCQMQINQIGQKAWNQYQLTCIVFVNNNSNENLVIGDILQPQLELPPQTENCIVTPDQPNPHPYHLEYHSAGSSTIDAATTVNLNDYAAIAVNYDSNNHAINYRYMMNISR